MPDLLRETFEEYARRAPAADGLREAVSARRRRDRVRRHRATALAAMLPLSVVAYFAVAAGVGGEPVPAPRLAAERPAPAGTRWVMRAGVEVAAPVEWFAATFDPCGTPTTDAVVLEAAPARGDCPARPVPHTSVLRLTVPGHPDVAPLRDRRDVVVDGLEARRLSGRNAIGQHVEAIVVESRGTAVVVVSDDAEVVRRVLGTLRISRGRDSRGCEIDIASPYARGPAAREGAATEMVPGTPVQASLCRYRGTRVVASALLGARETAALARSLYAGSQLVPGVPPLDLPQPEPIVVTFRYADGPDLVVYLHADVPYRYGASNGSATGPVGTEAEDLVRPLVGWRYVYDETAVRWSR